MSWITYPFIEGISSENPLTLSSYTTYGFMDQLLFSNLWHQVIHIGLGGGGGSVWVNGGVGGYETELSMFSGKNSHLLATTQTSVLFFPLSVL